jgi:hypothetical protein
MLFNREDYVAWNYTARNGEMRRVGRFVGHHTMLFKLKKLHSIELRIRTTVEDAASSHST